MSMRWSNPLFQADPRRAVTEALLLGAMLWALLLIFQVYISDLTWRMVLGVLIGPCCVAFCALRLSLSKSTWLRRIRVGGVIAGIVGVVLSGIDMAFAFWLIRQESSVGHLRENIWPFETAGLSLILDYVVFFCLRVGIRVWLFWDRLRRKQLVWALTHAHVMVVALGAALLIFFVDVLVLCTSANFSIIIPATLGIAALTIVAMVVVVPPSALFSFIVVRRTTRRLKTLTDATSALRKGNYAVRVPIMGEDEVAQLQNDFNVMATDLERAMRELRNERDTVSGLLAARRELIASVSHELRTPMATLRSYLETTLMHWEDGSPPTLQHDLQVMENEVLRLQVLVEDLFTLSRAEVGKLTLRCKPTDVGKLVQCIVEAGAPLAWRSSKIEIVADVPASVPLVLVDPGRLEQALQNLLHNAVRHTSPGGIVAFVVLEEADSVIIQVKDTGEGIAPEDLPQIWERFYQAESARNDVDGGAGLGLALVQELIEAMNGRVEVESVVSEGSCFTLRLPRVCT
jgi:signal transduction histidine kinase